MEALSTRPPLAGILNRFAAVLLDGLFTLIALVPLVAGAAMIVYFRTVAPNEVLFIFGIFLFLLGGVILQSHSALVLAMWAYGLSPGKWRLGIRAVKHDTSQPAGFWRMVLRETIGRLVAGILCYLGYVWVLVDANRQGWHDKIAKTLVIRTR